MSVLSLRVEDDAGPGSLRGYVERNSIALLSNLNKPPLDLSSPGWLGLQSLSTEVRASGLWNVNHVSESCEPGFIDRLEDLVTRMSPRRP
jgi:hypothetical protein